MEKLLKILEKTNGSIDYLKETKLIDSGLFDSFDIISLLAEIMDVYRVKIDVSELEPENFNSAQSIIELINKLLIEQKSEVDGR